jgi:hypothetical protein
LPLERGAPLPGPDEPVGRERKEAPPPMAINLRKRVALLVTCGVLAMCPCVLAEGNSAGGQDPPDGTLLTPDKTVVADALTVILPLLVQLQLL